MWYKLDMVKATVNEVTSNEPTFPALYRGVAGNIYFVNKVLWRGGHAYEVTCLSTESTPGVQRVYITDEIWPALVRLPTGATVTLTNKD